MKRIREYFNRTWIAIAAIILITISLIVWAQGRPRTPAKTVRPNTTKYVSFDGSYLFSVPRGYLVDAVSVNGYATAYSSDVQTLSGKSLDELYSEGVITVRSIKDLKGSNSKTFKDYASDKLAAELRKSLQSGSDVRYSKKGDLDVAQVYASLNDGTHLRATYAINFTQPVAVTAKEESDAFKVIAASLEEFGKSNLKPDIDQAAATARAIVDNLKRQDTSGIRKKGSKEFLSSVSKDQLAANLQESSAFLTRPVTVEGGLYDGQIFIAQLAFGSATKTGSQVGGILSLSKQGNNWRLDGFQLPKM